MAYRMGEARLEPRVDFDHRVKPKFDGSDISSDGDDPVMRAIVDRKDLDRMAVASSQMGCFETAFRATDANVAAPVVFPGIGSTAFMTVARRS